MLSVLALAAAVAGFMAGFLGVGGGIKKVPALYYAFSVLDFYLTTKSICLWNFCNYYTNIYYFYQKHMEFDAVDFKMENIFFLFFLVF
ncbi:MAG: hypothetical protein CM15mP129_03640 [Chloroflexota bacterium]|nr:MAG: hypothetical protein CM15mP129_03640 [Chloroflexota bacterium]